MHFKNKYCRVVLFYRHTTVYAWCVQTDMVQKNWIDCRMQNSSIATYIWFLSIFCTFHQSSIIEFLFPFWRFLTSCPLPLQSNQTRKSYSSKSSQNNPGTASQLVYQVSCCTAVHWWLHFSLWPNMYNCWQCCCIFYFLFKVYANVILDLRFKREDHHEVHWTWPFRPKAIKFSCWRHTTEKKDRTTLHHRNIPPHYDLRALNCK